MTAVEISRIEARLRAPRPQPNIERLREALTQRADEWKQTLRSEPRVARLLMPEFIKADAVLKTGLIDGLAEIQDMASPSIPSWNQIAEWLRSIDEPERRDNGADEPSSDSLTALEPT